MRDMAVTAFAATILIVACGSKDGDSKPGGGGGPTPARKVLTTRDAGLAVEELPPAPAGRIAGKKALVQFALYAKTDVSKQLEVVRSKSYKHLAPVTDVSPQMALPAVAIASESVFDYPPPAAELLSYVSKGLSEEQLAWVQKPEAVTLVGVFFAQQDALRINKDALRLVGEVAEKTGALVWDSQAGELQTAQVIAERLAGWKADHPVIWDHMSVHAVRDDELTHIDTVGMERFALPNLTVELVPPAFAEEMFLLVNLAAQTMLERGELATAGKLVVDVYALEGADERPEGMPVGQGVVTIDLVVAESSEREGRMWNIVFPGPPGTLHERQRAALDVLLGGGDDMTYTDHDPEMLAVSQRAIAELKELEPRFNKGLAPGESIYVKAPFETRDGGNEWMWLEVHQWKAGVVRGVLISEPLDVSNLKAGAKVEAKVDSLFDYVHQLPDGTRSGDATGKLMLKRQTSK